MLSRYQIIIYYNFKVAKHLSIFPFSCVLGDAQEFKTVHFPVTDNIIWAVWDSMEYTIQVQDNSCHDSKSLLELHVRKHKSLHFFPLNKQSLSTANWQEIVTHSKVIFGYDQQMEWKGRCLPFPVGSTAEEGTNSVLLMSVFTLGIQDDIINMFSLK